MSVQNQPERPEWMRTLGYFSLIVSELLGFTGVGLPIGYFAWKKWNAPAWLALLTTMGGLVLSMYRVYRLTQKDFD